MSPSAVMQAQSQRLLVTATVGGIHAIRNGIDGRRQPLVSTYIRSWPSPVACPIPPLQPYTSLPSPRLQYHYYCRDFPK